MLLSPNLLNPGPAAPLKILDAAERSDVWDVCQKLDQLTTQSWFNAAPQPWPLGRYAEQLIGAWLMRSSCWHLMHSHEQVRRANLTLGEVDFLVEPTPGRQPDPGQCPGAQHWEFSINFFLADPGLPDDALGPNRIDTLSSKCRRVFGKQLRLSQSLEFQQLFGSNWSSLALFQGWIFHPLLSPQTPCTIINQSAASGIWCSAEPEDMHRLCGLGQELKVEHWLVAQKPMWIAPRLLADFGIQVWDQFARPDPTQALQQWRNHRHLFGHDAPLLIGFANQHEVVRAFVTPQA